MSHMHNIHPTFEHPQKMMQNKWNRTCYILMLHSKHAAKQFHIVHNRWCHISMHILMSQIPLLKCDEKSSKHHCMGRQVVSYSPPVEVLKKWCSTMSIACKMGHVTFLWHILLSHSPCLNITKNMVQMRSISCKADNVMLISHTCHTPYPLNILK